MAGGFKSLSCLKFLTKLDLSSNSISTPLLASDFENSLRANLVWLSLASNQIPSIDSNVFMYPNGSSFWPKLAYLDLSNNLIKSFDVLWPLSIPNLNLQVDVSFNPISSLNNQLGGDFKASAFVAMTGNRSVDVTNNHMVLFDDTQVMQYNIGSSSGFSTFLTKLSNFDFRQTQNQFVCFCPASTGLYTVYWYSSVASSFINNKSPIFSLSCSNVAGNTVFNFPCNVSIF
jgi:hypothetical protein